MQSWFFLKNERSSNFAPPKEMSVIKTEEEPKAEILSQQWIFSVTAPALLTKEKICVTGSTPELGEWDYKRIVPLEYEPSKNLWSVTVTIPNTCDVYYRYVVCVNTNESNNLAVVRWESHTKPRVITESMFHPVIDMFGEYNDLYKVTRGWLTTQTLIQFKFLKNPLKLKGRMVGRLVNIKITPVKLSFGTNEGPQAEDTSNSDTNDVDIPPGTFIEVATLDNNPILCELRPQEQFGREYKVNDILLINVTTPSYDKIAYLIDFYIYSSHAATHDAPCHIGYTYVLPNMLKPSEGSLDLPVTCNVKHRPLGTISMEYLIVFPMPEVICDLKCSYAKHWDPSWKGLEVGHRGLGASFKKKGGNAIRENTIASLKQAAASGADLLEFDVQLSKDMIPVIYHDFHVCISMKRKKEIAYTEMLELPVKDLTLEHLQKLKVYHLVEGRNHETLFDDEDLEDHQPFPTLEEVFRTIDVHAGFNVELKWNMQMDDGSFELNNPFDMNVYVDKVLEVVLKYAGERRVVLSCFNPDICTMVRNKQSKYPVMFLTVGKTKKYQPYRDPRCLSIPAAVQSAISTDILGIVVHTEDLLRDPTQVSLATDAGLVIFCWGDDNNNKNTIKKLKEMGLHAVIYDKLDQFTTKEVKESIFLVEARESQHDIMQLAALKEGSSNVLSPVGSGVSGNRPYLDLASHQNLQELSTVTSLESLASSIDLKDEKNLKRTQELIANIGKEGQVKEPPRYFMNLCHSGDTSKGTAKKTRNN